MAKQVKQATQQQPVEFPKTSLMSATLRSDVQKIIDSEFSTVDAHMEGADSALFKCIVLDTLKKHIDALRDEQFATVSGYDCVMKMVDECNESESKLSEFNYMALQLSKSKAPESLDAKALLMRLRASYGKVIDKEFVDALAAQATVKGSPRKTFKIIQL